MTTKSGAPQDGAPTDGPDLPFRIFHNKRYKHTAYAKSAFDALQDENVRLGMKASIIEITVSAAHSQSD